MSEQQQHTTTGAGSSTDQHVTGAPERDAFPDDRQPTDVPVHGSSNAGVNATGANRREEEENG